MIELQSVGFQYQNRAQRSISGNSCTAGASEVIVIAGESGCGKSTLLRRINGLCPGFYEGTTEGKVLLAGQDVQNLRIGDISRIAATVFQNPDNQFFTLDVLSDLVFGCENFGVPRDEIERRLRSVVEMLSLERFLGRKFSELSGGEKQKIAIASALMLECRILLLDEPSANLDYPSIALLRRTIEELKERGYTIVVAEHRLYYLHGVCDQLIIMEQGTIVRRYRGAEMDVLDNKALNAFGIRGFDLFHTCAACEHTAAPAMGGAELLLLEHISFGYVRGQDVLRDVSLSVRAGDRIALLGHNGCGKSTLAKIICGLLRERGGRLSVGGEPLAVRRRYTAVSYVMQNVDFQIFGASLYNDLLLGNEEAEDIDARIRTVLAQFRLLPLIDEHPMRLSMGQKQRLVIAAACLLHKRIGIFDEPTSGLDYGNMRTVCTLIDEFTGAENAAIIITHDYEFIMNSCNRVILLEDGRIAEDFALRDAAVLERLFRERIR
ncbi:ABC transporter ATP-binding protein [Selenomonas massiliensis]|uniref:ABC transporter ATP-binding protein n=1 Tax=Selenomonas massiliensis TaxID=2058293 RepID=UPI000D105052|nr:energy-coupling factor ABC transporter ATP-binding protein [Selenomonas massiliensis]